MRTLPHSSECGEFFCTSVHFQTAVLLRRFISQIGAKELGKFSKKTPLVSIENRDVVVNSSLLFPPRPQPAISSHAFRLARFPFVLSASPFFCQNAAICAKTPLIYHILSEKDETKQDILQTFFIFASETYATIVVLLAAHLSGLCNRGISPDELKCSVEYPPHSQPALASSMGIMCVSVISRNKTFSCKCSPRLPSIRRQTILIRSFYPPFPPFTARR